MHYRLTSKTNRIRLKGIVSLLAGLIALMAGTQEADARQFALKTNLLYDATATINIGGELQVAPRWSVDLSANLNSWSFNHGRRWKHWMLQPEARYWLCEGTAGHFFAIHALGGQFNFGNLSFAHNFAGVEFGQLRDRRFQGWAGGVGLGYGYSWVLGRHWNIEAEIGLGYIYAKYDEYECEGCGRKTDKGHKGFFSPTKAAINIIYVF